MAKKNTREKNTPTSVHKYKLTFEGEEVEIFRREYKNQSELDDCLARARKWDHAGGDGVYGFIIGRSGVHIKVTDGKGKVVFKVDVKEEDLTNAESGLQIESKGNYFDETTKATQNKKYYYSCIVWYRFEGKIVLELKEPFDPSKLLLTCRSYVDWRGKVRKYIQFSPNPCDEFMKYGGRFIENIAKEIDGTPGGDDEMLVWSMENGVRKKLDVYPEED